MSRFAGILLGSVLFATIVAADPIVVLDRGVARSGGHVFWTGAPPAAGGQALAADVILPGFQTARGTGVFTPASGSLALGSGLLQSGSGPALTTPLLFSGSFTGLHTEGVALSRGDGRRGGRDRAEDASAERIAPGGAGGVNAGGNGVWGDPPGGGHAYGPGGNPAVPGNAYGPGGRKNGGDGMNTAPVPEPASIVLMGLMLLASAGLLRRHRFNRQAR